jgi:hypothetical protein
MQRKLSYELKQENHFTQRYMILIKPQIYSRCKLINRWPIDEYLFANITSQS